MQDDGADPTDVLLELVLSVACVDAFLLTKASLVNHHVCVCMYVCVCVLTDTAVN